MIHIASFALERIDTKETSVNLVKSWSQIQTQFFNIDPINSKNIVCFNFNIFDLKSYVKLST